MELLQRLTMDNKVKLEGIPKDNGRALAVVNLVQRRRISQTPSRLRRMLSRPRRMLSRLRSMLLRLRITLL